MTPEEAVTTLQEADAALNAASPTPFPLPIHGLEAVVAGALLGLDQGDWWVPGMRERVGGVLRDVPVSRLVDGFAGARPYKIAPPSPAPALRAVYAVGLAAAHPDHTVLVHLGIGSASDGGFYEALNLAALQEPHVLFLVAVHPLDDAAPVGPQLATTVGAVASAFNLPTHTVDGGDADAVRKAIVDAKNAGGPHVIVANL